MAVLDRAQKSEAGEIADLAGFLGGRDEGAGGHLAARRAGPAGERFDGDDFTGARTRQRLVDQPDLAIGEAVAEFVEQAEAAQRVAVFVRREGLQPGALLAGLVERHFGLMQKIGAAEARLLHLREAHARADVDAVAVQFDRLFEVETHVGQEGPRLLGAAGKQDMRAERVRGEPRDHGAAAEIADAGGQRLDQILGEVVADRGADAGETVDADGHDATDHAGLAAASQFDIDQQVLPRLQGALLCLSGTPPEDDIRPAALRTAPVRSNTPLRGYSWRPNHKIYLITNSNNSICFVFAAEFTEYPRRRSSRHRGWAQRHEPPREARHAGPAIGTRHR
ncbi:MAG: hypothetical protein R3C52_09370 [Hyphomonadaceae bacterium]